jgi:hypothetical protein
MAARKTTASSTSRSGATFGRARRLPLAFVLAVVLLAGVGSAAGGTPSFELTPLAADSTYEGAKSASGSMARTDRALLGREDATLVGVMIKYDFDPTASYAGGVGALAATSPAVTGKTLDANARAVRAYERHTESLTSRITAAVREAVPKAEIRASFLTAYGGVRARVPANRVAELLAVPGVVAVQRDALEQPQTSVTPAFVGATEVWPTLGGRDRAASNVIVGMIDTGIWPEHPSFADRGLPPAPGGPYACEFGDGSLGTAFKCNDKLIGAYAFTDAYVDAHRPGADEYCNNVTRTCSARDSEGHGTHTASTAAGSRVDSAPLFGIDRGPISGIAPGARVIAYRVCLRNGCFDSDTVAAVEQAILDGVDVLNFSVEGGTNPYADPVELAFLDAFNAGISVNAAAGNTGPAPGSVSHAGPWVTTVGGSTSNRVFTTTLRLAAADGATFQKSGMTITPGVSGLPVVLAGSIPGYSSQCLTPLALGPATGKVVACARGGNERVDKGFNVMQGGGAGMILYNTVPQDVETDNHWLPTVHLDGPNAELTTFLSSHSNVTATWAAGAATPTHGDVMAPFSGRGPQSDFLKPDLTAPGIQVVAGHSPTPARTRDGPPGQLFQVRVGSSMASAHATGVSALVRAAHPAWTPAMVKSALMTSAAQGVVKQDGVTPADPFDAGAGSLRADRAVHPTLVFDESYANYVASEGNPLHRIDLNLPSVNAPTMTGTITTKRTAINVSGKHQELVVSVEAPPGATIVVSDRKPGKHGAKADKRIQLHERGPTGHGATDLWITISAPTLADGQYFGRITLDPKKKGYSEATIPVAFLKRQGLVTLTHACSPTEFPAGTGHAHCAATVANQATVPAEVSLTVTNLDRAKGLDFTNVSAPATAIKKDDGVRWNGTLSPALPPQVTSITPGGAPSPYLSLGSIGAPLLAGIGDDTITNVNTPPFMYGGELYNRIGIVSNGYLVIGGGTNDDLVFNPQQFPDAARPNNVVAPFWSDLNPTAAPAGGGVRLAGLSGGGMQWIVIDWNQVPNFSNPTPHSFQVWLRVGTTAASEQVSMAYGAANSNAPDPDAGVSWGAENRDGTSGKVIPAPGPPDNSQFRVNLAPPAPGGTATVEYDASSKKAGTYQTVAAMTSNVTPGTTQVVQTLTVTKP